jgi:hypothetical protein
MDTKNLEAMSRGREYMLAKFANLPFPAIPGTVSPRFIESPCVQDAAVAQEAVNEFRRQFGDLSPQIEPNTWHRFVLSFRYHWHWRRPEADRQVRRRNIPLSFRMQAGSHEKQQIDMDDPSAWSTNLLNLHALKIEVDFSSGRITITPQTLLDWLVLSLIECRRGLAICAREACATSYFVKTHPRTKYCSIECFHLERERGQKEWERANRGTHKRGAAKRKS